MTASSGTADQAIARFHCSSTEDFGDTRAVIVLGTTVSGTIGPGMLLNLDLSATFGLTCPIIEVLDSGALLIDCDDQEGVDMFLAFDVEDEILDVLHPSA